MSKSLEQQLQELNVKHDDSVRTSQDLGSNKSRLEAENSELARQLSDVESQVSCSSFCSPVCYTGTIRIVYGSF